MSATASRPVSAEPITKLDEKYISNSIMFDAMTASVTLFLDGDGLRNAAGELDQDAIRHRLDAASWAAPALRKRLRRATLGLSAAAWVPVERLDLQYHVRFHHGIVTEVPASYAMFAGRGQGRLARDAPPWRVLFAELDSGAVALVFSWQHVMGDATYGTEVLQRISDTAPAPAIRVVTDTQRRSIGRAPRSGVGMLAHIARTWWAGYGSGAERWSAYRSRPFGRRLRRVGARLVRPARDGIIRVRKMADRIPARDFRMMQFDLAESQALAQHHGGSLNDLTVAAAFKAIFDTRPELEEAALLVPISGRRAESTVSRPGVKARNAVGAVRVVVPAGLEFGSLVTSARAQVRRGAVSRIADSLDGPRLGYATMVPTGEVDRYFGTARVTSIAGWPAGDPRDDIAVLASSFADTLTIAVSTFATTDIDAFVASMSACFVGASESA